ARLLHQGEADQRLIAGHEDPGLGEIVSVVEADVSHSPTDSVPSPPALYGVCAGRVKSPASQRLGGDAGTPPRPGQFPFALTLRKEMSTPQWVAKEYRMPRGSKRPVPCFSAGNGAQDFHLPLRGPVGGPALRLRRATRAAGWEGRGPHKEL